MNGSFKNTIQSEGQQLIQFETAAQGQEKTVLELLQSIKKAAFWEVKKMLPDIHQDSLKRSLSNLQERGLIVKDTIKENMVTNPETGKRCHRYHIIQKQVA